MNKDELNKLAASVANQADSLEIDVAAISDEDDIMAALSHVEILAQRTATLRAKLREALES